MIVSLVALPRSVLPFTVAFPVTVRLVLTVAAPVIPRVEPSNVKLALSPTSPVPLVQRRTLLLVKSDIFAVLAVYPSLNTTALLNVVIPENSCPAPLVKLVTPTRLQPVRSRPSPNGNSLMKSVDVSPINESLFAIIFY